MKILITILLALFISSNASADLEVIKIQSEQDDDTFPYKMRTLCIDGYKWVHIGKVMRLIGDTAGQTISTTMNQFMIEKDGRSVPAKC